MVTAAVTAARLLAEVPGVGGWDDGIFMPFLGFDLKREKHIWEGV